MSPTSGASHDHSTRTEPSNLRRCRMRTASTRQTSPPLAPARRRGNRAADSPTAASVGGSPIRRPASTTPAVRSPAPPAARR